MPCCSDYLDPSGQELESKRVCQLLCYTHAALGKNLPPWVRDAAKDYYGNVNRLDEATSMLCADCRLIETDASLREKVIYDGHNATARRLADWYERHKEWDERRVNEEGNARKKAISKERALKKLTNEELDALGLI